MNENMILSVSPHVKSPRTTQKVMLDVMFDLPSREDISACRITADTINKVSGPELIPGERQPRKPAAKRARKAQREPKKSA